MTPPQVVRDANPCCCKKTSPAVHRGHHLVPLYKTLLYTKKKGSYHHENSINDRRKRFQRRRRYPGRHQAMTANGVFALSAITALTAQNTTGVTGYF